MVCLKCKECGNNTQGFGPENKWWCPKCNNKILLGKLLQMHEKGLVEGTDLIGQNKSLLKTIKKLQGMESGEEDKASESSSEWVPCSAKKKSPKSAAKWKLFQVTSIPPHQENKKKSTNWR